MPILPLALPTGSNVGREPHAGVARLINCYSEPSGEDQRSPMQVWASPGLDSLVTLAGTGGVRGMIEVDGVAYVVVGRTLHQVDPGGNAVAIGGIPSDGYVGMARNQRGTGVQTIIVCDGPSWVTTGGTLARITDGDLPPVCDVCVINRSAVFATKRGGMFRSEIDDATVVDGLDTAEAESAPDKLHRVVARGGGFVSLGEYSYEIWMDQGSEAFGFSRQTAGLIGSVGPRSVTDATVLGGGRCTDAMAWVATDQSGKEFGVVIMEGTEPRTISTAYIARKIENVPDKTSIIASSWISRGHGFISFRLPDTSLIYDTTTGAWHERQSRTSSGAPTAWRVSLATVLNGRVLVGDAENPKLYWLDEDTADEDGDEMIVTVRTPPANAWPGRLEMNHLYLDIVPGVGTGQGASQDVTPYVSMRKSYDGENWGAIRTRQLGQQGERMRRVSWTSIGTFATCSFEFSASAAVARGFMQAKWDGRVIKP